MTNVGTPDYQRGVYAPQKLVGSFNAGDNNKIVGVPPNAEILWIVVVAQSGTLASPHAVGVTTGNYYPVYRLPAPSDGEAVQYAVIISMVKDAQVEIEWTAAPATAWFVISDPSSRFVVDLSVSSALGIPSTTPPVNVLVVGGSDGLYARILATDPGGRLLPAPSGILAAGVVNNAGQLLPAPAAGTAYWITGVDTFGAGAAADAGLFTTAAGTAGTEVLYLPCSGSASPFSLSSPLRVSSGLWYYGSVNQACGFIIRGYAGP